MKDAEQTKDFTQATLDYIVDSIRASNYGGAVIDERRQTSLSILLYPVDDDEWDVEIGCYIKRVVDFIEGLGADCVSEEDTELVYRIGGYCLSFSDDWVPESNSAYGHAQICIEIETVEAFREEYHYLYDEYPAFLDDEDLDQPSTI